MADKGKPPEAQVMIQNFINLRNQGLEAGLRELRKHKVMYDKCLLEGDRSCFQYYILEFDKCPPVMCSFGCNPEYDFEGKQLQDLDDRARPFGFLTCSIIGTEKGGAAVFGWIAENSTACLELIQSLDRCEENLVPEAIIRFAFEYGENTYFSPTWWRELDKGSKEIITRRAVSGTPGNARDNKSLQDDGLRAIRLSISSKTTNLVL
jgi:hypothetical protein